jgi:hypothetical protein
MSVHRFFSLMAILLLPLSSGCLHRRIEPTMKYSLEVRLPGPVLTPLGSHKAIDGQFQLTPVNLPTMGSILAQPDQHCSIRGSDFSLYPAVPVQPGQWTIRSPSVEGWQEYDDQTDLISQWRSFTHQIANLLNLGCFSSSQTVFTITRAVAEKIPLPAGEALLFFYSFGGEGYVDLAPGMRIDIEKPLNVEAGKGTSPLREQTAQYDVIALQDTGVALHLSKTSNQHPGLPNTAGVETLFSLSTRFEKERHLRLFLESVSEGNRRTLPILLGAVDPSGLDAVTERIKKQGTIECPQIALESVACVTFESKSAVSLFTSISLNNRMVYVPFGTTLRNLIETHTKNEANQVQAIQTVTLLRPLSLGGYASIIFPKTLEDARQLILLSGDRIAWRTNQR